MTNPKLMLTLRKAAKRLSLGGRVLLAQRLLRRCFRNAKGIAHIDDFDGDLTIDLRLSEHMQRRMFWMGYYNREIVALLKGILHPGMVMIDVGANIGEITLVAAKLAGSTGRVIAFEPVSDIAASLEQSVARNRLKQVTVARLGLSDTNGTAPLYASCGQGRADDENYGLGTLYGGSETDNPLQTIQLTTLDAYLHEHAISRLDIVKIDIEGAELPCLKGAGHTLSRYKPLLIIEIQEQTSVIAGYRQSDILDYLETFGYAFHAIGRNGRLTPLDARHLSAYQNVLCTPAGNNSPPGAMA
ncbi:FkbM family methyltransferase [Frateuria defendens]|uniref:FkbM family methyltransferase n=1 Tax=Frateuria defendens TaxID=2219559 RepID=UPI0013791748|nr:FkbM family methyltransferase [Frateuria defendens]